MKYKGVMSMNMSIKCQVTECKYNENNEHYCMLNKIEIVKNCIEGEESNDFTDCGSFEHK